MQGIQQCKVFGPFNAGTTLMQRYLHNLFIKKSPDLLKFWKHSLPPVFYPYPKLPEDKPVVMPFKQVPEVLFVCMVRSPYFWINSSLNNPYNFSFQTQSRDKERLLRSPVVLRKHQKFKNIIHVWNHYYQGYAEQLEKSNTVIYIRLEELVRDTATTLQKFDFYLERIPEVDFESTIKRISGVPSKTYNTHGQEWEEKNQDENIYRFFNNSELDFINRQLDKKLMKKFSYPLAWQPPKIG